MAATHMMLSSMCKLTDLDSAFSVYSSLGLDIASDATILHHLQLWLLAKVFFPVWKFELRADTILFKLEDALCPEVPDPAEVEVCSQFDTEYVSYVPPSFVDEFGEVPEEAYLSPEEREVIQKPTFLTHEHWASESSGSSFLDDIEVLADEKHTDDCIQDVCTDMPPDYQIMWDEGAVDAVWSSRFECEEPPKPKFQAVLTDKVCDPVVIQDAINDIFPFHHEMDDRYFQTMVETDDISLEVSKCWIDASNFRDFTKGQSSYAEPVYQSGATSRRVNTQRETLLAVKKRNMNIPELQSVFDLDAEVNLCTKRFLTHVIDMPRLRRLPPMMGCEIDFFTAYLAGKNPPIKEYQGPLSLVALDKYLHMVKTIIKPVEDNSLKYERPLCATITYHKKGIVMQSSPLFLSAMSRLFYVLKSKIHIPSGKWHQLFTLDAAHFDAAKWFKEVDFSKFDKSQGELHHLVQRNIFHALKLPPEFVEMWFTSHERSHIIDRETGVGFSVDFQRRTGDANTYLGNTLVNLICLARVYNLSDPNITFVIASGDDSLIGSLVELPRDSEDLFSTLFNFEAKFPHNQPFICSKFLVSVDLKGGGREVIAVPNPAKLLIRMGRRDCQFQAMEDVFTSWLDVIYYFRDARVCERVADLCAYRQTRRPSMYLLSALLSLPSCFANFKKFASVCYHLTGNDCLKLKTTKSSQNGCPNDSSMPTHVSRRGGTVRKSCSFPRTKEINRDCQASTSDVKNVNSLKFGKHDNVHYHCNKPLPVEIATEAGRCDENASSHTGSFTSSNSRPRNRFRAKGVHQPRGGYSNHFPPNNWRSS